MRVLVSVVCGMFLGVLGMCAWLAWYFRDVMR